MYRKITKLFPDIDKNLLSNSFHAQAKAIFYMWISVKKKKKYKIKK